MCKKKRKPTLWWNWAFNFHFQKPIRETESSKNGQASIFHSLSFLQACPNYKPTRSLLNLSNSTQKKEKEKGFLINIRSSWRVVKFCQWLAAIMLWFAANSKSSITIKASHQQTKKKKKINPNQKKNHGFFMKKANGGMEFFPRKKKRMKAKGRGLGKGSPLKATGSTRMAQDQLLGVCPLLKSTVQRRLVGVRLQLRSCSLGWSQVPNQKMMLFVTTVAENGDSMNNNDSSRGRDLGLQVVYPGGWTKTRKEGTFASHERGNRLWVAGQWSSGCSASRVLGFKASGFG